MTAKDIEDLRTRLRVCPCTHKQNNPEYLGEWCPLLYIVYLRKKQR